MAQTGIDSERDEVLVDILENLPAPDTDLSVKADLFSFLGRAHMIELLHEFAVDPGPWRFSEFREALDIPPTTLTDRLGELTTAGLIVRESYDEIPPRVEYTATGKVLDLRPTFRCLSIWMAQHNWDDQAES